MHPVCTVVVRQVMAPAGAGLGQLGVHHVPQGVRGVLRHPDSSCGEETFQTFYMILFDQAKILLYLILNFPV